MLMMAVSLYGYGQQTGIGGKTLDDENGVWNIEMKTGEKIRITCKVMTTE
jgi:hypothetical protein